MVKITVELTNQEIVDIMRGLRNAIGRLQERRRRVTSERRRQHFIAVESRLGKTYNKLGKIAWKNNIQEAFGLDDPV
jgi:hypothetical protein